MAQHRCLDVISTLQLVARPPYPMAAHDSLAQGARWLEPKVGQRSLEHRVQKIIDSYDSRHRRAAA